MLFDSIKLVEGSEVQNLLVDSGPTFPPNPSIGELFFRTGVGFDSLFFFNGSSWMLASAASSYTLPISTATTLGGVKIGSGLSISSTGVVSSSGGTVTSVAGTGTINGLTLTGAVTSSGSLTLGGTLSNIANTALTNSSVTIGSTNIALGSTSTTLAGLTSVTSTTFVGNLSGHATSANFAYDAAAARLAGSTTQAFSASTFSGSGSGLTGAAVNLTSGSTLALTSTTSTINVANAAAPSAGQVLTATSASSATWQTIPVSTIVENNLISTSTTNALSALQGTVLNEDINNLELIVSNLSKISDEIFHVQVGISGSDHAHSASILKTHLSEAIENWNGVATNYNFSVDSSAGPGSNPHSHTLNLSYAYATGEIAVTGITNNAVDNHTAVVIGTPTKSHSHTFPYDMSFSLAVDFTKAINLNKAMGVYVAARPIFIRGNFSDSLAMHQGSVNINNPLQTAEFTLRKNSIPFATVTFSNRASAGVINSLVSGSNIQVVRGDFVDIISPTLIADFILNSSVTIVGYAEAIDGTMI